MEPALSLASYLTSAAVRWPQALAVHSAERQWTYPEWQTRVSALAETIEASRQALRVSGSSLDLAGHAFACSLKNRPFFPVDRNTLSVWRILHEYRRSRQWTGWKNDLT